MKNFWKVLGVAALAVGLTPYKVEKDEERGEKRYQALLWQATVSSGEGEEKKVDVNLGFKSPADKEGAEKAADAAAEAAEKAAETVQEAKEAVCDAVETACEAVEDAAE